MANISPKTLRLAVKMLTWCQREFYGWGAKRPGKDREHWLEYEVAIRELETELGYPQKPPIEDLFHGQG